jgi:amino acid adenylation domain-containing protein
MNGDCFIFPMSFAQQRLWFLDQMNPGNPFYNIFIAQPLNFSLNTRALERSVNEIVRRHEALRTTFRVVDGQPCQLVTQHLRLAMPVIDLRSRGEADRGKELQLIAAEESRRPFDLSKGPLIRTNLGRLGEREYVFLLTMHHIVSDGWSMGVFWQELGVLYEAYSSLGPSPLEELGIQYPDFAVWQREWLTGEVLERQLSYWKRQLANLPVLRLPTDHPRPALLTYRGAHYEIQIPDSLGQGLRELSRKEGATLFMTLLAAFAILLHRYADETDIVIGSTTANRSRKELEALIGFFVNSVVLRVDLSGDPSFRDAVQRTREVALGAYAHQDLPFERLVEELRPERDLSRNPLFQTTFQLINTPTFSPSGGPAAPVGGVKVQRGTAIFDLALTILDSPSRLSGLIEYSTDLFEPATIARMGGHFQYLLEAAVLDPACRISQLSMLSPDEYEQAVATWNETAASQARACIHELFEQQVERTPESVAAVHGTTALTYSALNRRANGLARYLRSRGVGPDRLVAVCYPKSLELIVILLAVLKAGGAYLLLDRSYPTERLLFLLEDSGAALVLADGANNELFSSFKVTTVDLDMLWRAGSCGSDANLCSEATLDNIAYVIYTSGSTGRPKGVMIPHGAICNHMLWMQSAYCFSDSDRVLQRTAPTFDASVWEFYAPLLAGGCLVIAPPEAQRDPAAIVKVMAEQSVTTVQLVPTLLQLVIAEDGLAECASLRHVFCGGEALRTSVVRQLRSIVKAEVHNLYGPTETTIDATAWTCSGGESREVIPIGRPISNTQAYVLDSNLNPVPVGVSGELYLSGAGLARGYINSPGQTAEKFLPCPFAAEPGDRMYRSGDLARYLPNGSIEFLDRHDRQIKLHGLRIELGEIEATLRTHPAVRESVATVREDHPDDVRIVAYVVQNNSISASGTGGVPPMRQTSTPRDPPIMAAELRRHVMKKLPEYMVPSRIVLMDEIPLMSNGKINRMALPPPVDIEATRDLEYEPPANILDEALCRIWADVLNVPYTRIGIRDNFFSDLGGHSLLATQLVSRVRSALRLDVPIQRIFESPTVAEFSSLLAKSPDELRRLSRIAELLLQVERMSAREVEGMLSGMK